MSYSYFPLTELNSEFSCILPIDIMKILIHDYFHPIEALISIRLCKKIYNVLNYEIIHRKMLLYVKNEHISVFDRFKCNKCFIRFGNDKFSFNRHIQKHKSYEKLGKKWWNYEINTCDECNYTYNNTDERHICPLEKTFCSNRYLYHLYKWAENLCQKTFYINEPTHKCSARCKECGVIFDNDKFLWGTNAFILHFEECVNKRDIINKYLIDMDYSEDDGLGIYYEKICPSLLDIYK